VDRLGYREGCPPSWSSGVPCVHFLKPLPRLTLSNSIFRSLSTVALDVPLSERRHPGCQRNITTAYVGSGQARCFPLRFLFLYISPTTRSTRSVSIISLRWTHFCTIRILIHVVFIAPQEWRNNLRAFDIETRVKFTCRHASRHFDRIPTPRQPPEQVVGKSPRALALPFLVLSHLLPTQTTARSSLPPHYSDRAFVVVDRKNQHLVVRKMTRLGCQNQLVEWRCITDLYALRSSGLGYGSLSAVGLRYVHVRLHPVSRS
jgi:hypothetical protein